MDFVSQNIFWVAIAVMSGAALLWLNLRGGGDGISQQDAVIMMNREHAIVVDVRDASEFSSGHLPGARHFPLDNLELGASDLDKFKKRPCIVYCERGLRSGKAKKILAGRGFDRVHSLAGGIDAWREAGMPVDQ